MIYFLNLIAHRLRILWSNFYWRKARKRYGIKYADKKDSEDTPHFVNSVANRMYKKFRYKSDGIEELGDSAPPPAEMYAQYCEQDTFADDCDGFHAGLYHALYENGITCFLLSILSKKNEYGHCVVCFEYEGRTYIQDYFSQYDGDTLEDVIRTFYMGCTGGACMLFGKEFDYVDGKYRYKYAGIKEVSTN